MSELGQAVRQPARGIAPAAILAQPVSTLVGVGGDAVDALAGVGIHTVLDLGASALFGLAQRVAALADGEAGAAAATPLPADMLDDEARGRTAAEVAAGPLGQLRMLNLTQSKALVRALAAPTVRDLGLWPPALAARRLVQQGMGSTEPGVDPAAPEELQPRMGQLPVDRVVYQQLYFECLLADIDTALSAADGKGDAPAEAPAADVAQPPPGKVPFNYHQALNLHSQPVGSPPLPGMGDMPVDLTPAVLGRGFEAPGLGLRLSLAQTWTPVGLSLGQLLHSVALAPGEATRVAMVDWSRSVTTRTAEDISEDEDLSASLSRNRAISEITGSVAREMQEGRSNFNTTGASWGLGAGAAGQYKGVTAAVNFGYSRTDANGSAFSSSSGMRDISASASQNVQDSTEQNASLSRGRRASIVSEVGTREAERLSTRVVANYNHMHALSVLYFEVVQLYRTRTEVVDVEPLLYLPVQPFDFANEALVERYRGLLAEVALNPAARNALLGIDRNAQAGDTPARVPGLATLTLAGSSFEPPYLSDTALDPAGLRLALGQHASFENSTLKVRSDEAALVEVQVSGVYDSNGKLVDPAYESIVVQGDGSPAELPVTPWAPLTTRKGEAALGAAPEPYRAVLGTAWNEFGAWTSLRGRRTSASVGDTRFSVRFLLRRRDRQGQLTGDPVGIRLMCQLASGSEPQHVAICSFVPDAQPQVKAPPAPPFDLAVHLRANALHYTMALLRRADPGMLGLVLGRMRLLGRPLLSQVDAVPVAHAGNYLVFRWRLLTDTPEWQHLLKRRGLLPEQRLSAVREALVPVASGGVFAEAVLGRFNSAEKLDLTRFWNWQDSPIPLVPTEIAPLQAGIRQGGQALQPGTLGPANLRQQDAPAAPDPGAALSGILGAVTKGESFRNMSGLEKLLEQGGTAMTLSAQGAREFMAKAMETVSSYGARVNHGRDMDTRKQQQAAAAGSGSAAVGTGTGSGGGQGGGGSAGGAPGSTPAKLGPGGSQGKPGPGDHETGAFVGPGATPPQDEAPEARPGPAEQRRFSQSFSVEIRTGVPDAGPFSRGRALMLDGELELGRLPTDTTPLPLPSGEPFVPPDALAGIARIAVAGGTGSAAAALATTDEEDLVPALTLYVRRVYTLGFEFVGPRIPGVPSTFEDELALKWGNVNPVAIATPALPLTGGPIRLRIAVTVQDRLAIQRMHDMLGTGTVFAERTERSVTIPLAGVADGAPLDGDGLAKLKAHVVEALDPLAVRADIQSTFNLLGTTRNYAPVLGCQMRYDAAAHAIVATFPWAALADCQSVDG